jgi:hypothetical protein
LPTDDGFVEITFASATGPSIESEEEGQLTRSARKPIAKQTSPLLTHFRFAASLGTARLTAVEHGAMKELPRKHVIGVGPVGTCRTPKHAVPAFDEPAAQKNEARTTAAWSVPQSPADLNSAGKCCGHRRPAANIPATPSLKHRFT